MLNNHPSPIRFDDGIEAIEPDEAALTQEIVAHMAAQQARHAEEHRHAHRDAHAKSHAVLKGRLTIHDDLPRELAQGVFAAAGAYDVVARLSSAPGNIHSDAVPAPRGFAIKLLGVPGERLLPDLGGANQDFLMVNVPTLTFGTIAKYRWMLPLLEHAAEGPEAVQRLVAATARGVKGAVEGLGGVPNATVDGLARDHANMLGETFYTQAAIRYGDHVAKLSLAPVGEVSALTDVPVGDGPSAMADAVFTHFATAGAAYELRTQLCIDLDTMPVEDAAILWDPAVSPHRAIATLRFEPQDTASPARRVYGDDHLAFNPWNGVVEHRPLGGIMRIRRPAYESSSAQRHRINAVPRGEPNDLSDIPD